VDQLSCAAQVAEADAANARRAANAEAEAEAGAANARKYANAVRAAHAEAGAQCAAVVAD
jgi:hypothetical protein